MKRWLQNSKKPKFITVLAIFLLPIPVLFSYAYYASLEEIQRHLQSVASFYANRIDALVSDLHRKNARALYASKSCAQLQEEFLFENLSREILIVENQRIVCSSKRGEMQLALSPDYPEDIITSQERLVDLNNDPQQRTLLITNTDKNNPQRGVILIVDKEAISARLGYQNDHRIARLTVKIGDEYYPPNRQFLTHPHSVLVHSAKQLFSLQIVASDEFVSEEITFYLLRAIPASLILSLLIFILGTFFHIRSDLLDDLKKALARKELFLVYQPVVSSTTKAVVGYEALTRWTHPKLGNIKPDRFIPIAEEYDVIHKLTDYIIKQVEQDALYFQEVYIGINIPPSYLTDKRHIQRLIQCGNILAEHKIQLTAEITERQLLEKSSQEAIQVLRAAGVMVAIDDFGTGHTALSVLQDVAFDCLKIDKCFIDSIGVESVNTPVLNTIIELAHQLKVDIVAEGVETAVQADYLQAKGVQYQQGYYHSKPLSLHDLR